MPTTYSFSFDVAAFDIGIIIGRFQPFHKAHSALLNHALNNAARVIVVLGSSLQARSAKNPFSEAERMTMILSTLTKENQARIKFITIRDHYDDEAWKQSLLLAIEAQCTQQEKIALIGFQKDASSYYLNFFPNWHFINITKQGEIDGTKLRKTYFESPEPQCMRSLFLNDLPPTTAQFLDEWQYSDEYKNMKEEYLAIEQSKKIWGTGPFITTDTIVQSCNHVLLIKRKHSPGKGLWAIPGGFLDSHEKIIDCAIRELQEETQIPLSKETFVNSLKKVDVFDHPNRSIRGRIITHAYYLNLNNTSLPAVKGDDDASLACWIPISQLIEMEPYFFEDHFKIINHFLAFCLRK